jgi:hypothetical protein
MIFVSFLLVLSHSKAEDFNFSLIPTPNGDKYRLGQIKAFNQNNIIISQVPSSLPNRIFEDEMSPYISLDNGDHWSANESYGIVLGNTCYEATDQNTIYSVPMLNYIYLDGDKFYDAGLFKTTDLGKTWQWKTSFGEGMNYVKNFQVYKILKPDDERLIFISCNSIDKPKAGVLFFSDNDGDNTNSGTLSGLSDITFYNKTRTFYVSSKEDCLTLSTTFEDNILLKTLMNKPLWFRILRIDDSGILYGLNDSTLTEEKGIYISTDNGYNWNLIKKKEKDIYCMEVFNNCLIVGTENGLEYTTDKGTTWLPASLPEINGSDKGIYTISINHYGDIYAVYGKTNLIRGRINISGISEENDSETAIYPNPANNFIYYRQIAQTQMTRFRFLRLKE